MGSQALKGQNVEARKLTSADLLVGVRNVPVRVVEKHWEETEGPDALLVFLSNGSNFTVHHEPGGAYRIRDRGMEIAEISEEKATGLTRATLNQLGDEVFRRFAEHQQEVE